ncbi:hypothetical protein M3J07_005996 [Ascochyta lentis]
MTPQRSIEASKHGPTKAADAVYKGLPTGTLMGTAHRLDTSSTNYNEPPPSYPLPTNYTHHVSMQLQHLLLQGRLL